MSNSYIVKTLGCKANLYDSQLLEAELQKKGMEALLRDRGNGTGSLRGQ